MADYLLDTNILILHLRGHPRLKGLLSEWSENRALHVSAITRTEVVAGMHPHEEDRTLALLDSLDLVPVEAAIADRAGRLIYQYARRGTRLSFADALIAATAVQHDFALVTTNAQHFPMPELTVHTL